MFTIDFRHTTLCCMRFKKKIVLGTRKQGDCSNLSLSKLNLQVQIYAHTFTCEKVVDHAEFHLHACNVISRPYAVAPEHFNVPSIIEERKLSKYVY